jgi:prepilin signal peptidase PulO-like enzyme (type II secretory pathway)
VLTLIVTGCFEAIVIAVGVRARGNARAAALGLAAACGYALTATLMKSAVSALSQGVVPFFTSWQLYATAVAGVGALFLLQNGLQAGSLVAVQPPLTLGDALISASYGVTVFNENVRTGGWLLVIEIAAVIAVAIGCIELSRSLALMSAAEPAAELSREPAADRRPGPNRPRRRLAPARGHRTTCPTCDALSSWPRPLPSRCPACGTRTGPPTLAIAVVMAILLGTLAARVHPGLVLAAACWLAACAVPLAFVDAAVRRLPDRLTVPAYAGTALLLAASGHWPILLRAVLGGLALAGFYLALLLISPSAMGLGDVKPAAALGTLLAWFGWRPLIAVGAAGFLLGGLVGIALLVSGRATKKQHIPFGPVLVAGAFLVILL